MKYKFSFKKANFFFLLLFIVIYLLMFICGCGSKNIVFSIGVSQVDNSNQKILSKKIYEFFQTKEKIVDNEIIFQRNNATDNYDNLYINFEGNSIESVVFLSENAKMLNTNLSEHSYYVDSFSLYKEVTEEQLKSDFSDCKSEDDEENYQYDSTKILKKLWDNGEFDDIKNVYFSGENSDRVFLTGSEKNKTYDITGIFSNENFNIDEAGNFGKPQKSQANYMGETSEISTMFYQWNMTNHLYDEKTAVGTDTGFDSDNITLQPDEVTIKYNQSEYNSVRWVYEILYNDAFKNGKTEGLIAEDNIKINVKYAFGQSEDYKLRCKLYADGKITFKLEK